MVHLIALYKFNTDVDNKGMEEIARAAQTELLKVPTVLAVRAGRRLDDDSEWPFYFSVEVESMAKLAKYRDDPMQIHFIEKHIKPNVWSEMELLYELEPGRDVKYS